MAIRQQADAHRIDKQRPDDGGVRFHDAGSNVHIVYLSRGRAKLPSLPWSVWDNRLPDARGMSDGVTVCFSKGECVAKKSILIVGADPALIDFSAPDAPKEMNPDKIMAGLNDSVARLEAAGHGAELLLTRDAAGVDAQVTRALQGKEYDVIVIGAGLRTLPALADQFERLINVLHLKAPRSKFAFNSRPDDSDAAAQRWL